MTVSTPLFVAIHNILRERENVYCNIAFFTILCRITVASTRESLC